MRTVVALPLVIFLDLGHFTHQEVVFVTSNFKKKKNEFLGSFTNLLVVGNVFFHRTLNRRPSGSFSALKI